MPSFGSITFPRERSHLTALFDTLLSLHPVYPFILALDPDMMNIPSEVVVKLKARVQQETALLVKWAPQQTILQHPVSRGVVFATRRK